MSAPSTRPCYSHATFSLQLPSPEVTAYCVNDDCAEADKLILEIAHYRNDYADIAAEKL